MFQNIIIVCLSYIFALDKFQYVELCRKYAVFTLSVLDQKNFFFDKSGQRNQNFQLKRKFGTKTDLNMQNSMMLFQKKFFFLGKFGPKIQNCLFKVKFDTKINSNMQNSIVMSILSVLD